jgi:hypothetical protein
MRPLWRRHRTWIITAALVVAPLGGVALILYGLAKMAVNKRRGRPVDPYAEWLALREQLRWRNGSGQSDGEQRRSTAVPRG